MHRGCSLQDGVARQPMPVDHHDIMVAVYLFLSRNTLHFYHLRDAPVPTAAASRHNWWWKLGTIWHFAASAAVNRHEPLQAESGNCHTAIPHFCDGLLLVSMPTDLSFQQRSMCAHVCVSENVTISQHRGRYWNDYGINWPQQSCCPWSLADGLPMSPGQFSERLPRVCRETADMPPAASPYSDPELWPDTETEDVTWLHRDAVH